MKKPMKTLSSLVLAAAIPLSAAAAEPSAQDFPFQPQAFQFRLNQGFFRAGGELFEDILKASGTIDKNNTIKFVDKDTGFVNYLRYRKMKAAIRLEEGKIIGNLQLDISDSRFAVRKVSDRCLLLLTGTLAFETRLELLANGSVRADLPQDKFQDQALKIQTQGCGLISFLVKGIVRSSMQSTLEETIGKVANDQELSVVVPANVGDALKAARVAINTPSRGPLDGRLNKADGQFDIDMGVHGYLSNARDSFERIAITNPRKAYMNQVGLQWSLDAGLDAKSKNIYHPSYRSSDKAQAVNGFPEWGLAPYKREGKAIDFDGGLMIRTGFLKTLFEKLYEAGFFNLQIQDSLLNKQMVSLDPTSWGEALKVVTPDGRPLTKANYADSRLVLRLASPPALTVRNDKEFQLSVADFHLIYYVKTKGSAKEFEALKLRAKFNLVTNIGMDEDARLAFRFNEKPVQEFQVVSRAGVDASVPDARIESELNKAVIGLLNKSSIEIPFLQGRKIEIRSLGIDGGAGRDQALSMYLKIK